MVPFQSESSKYPASAGHFFAQNRPTRKDFIASQSRGCVCSPFSRNKSAQWCEKVPPSSRLEGRCQDFAHAKAGGGPSLPCPLPSQEASGRRHRWTEPNPQFALCSRRSRRRSTTSVSSVSVECFRDSTASRPRRSSTGFLCSSTAMPTLAHLHSSIRGASFHHARRSHRDLACKARGRRLQPMCSCRDQRRQLSSLAQAPQNVSEAPRNLCRADIGRAVRR
jgi:hypothetical protein